MRLFIHHSNGIKFIINGMIMVAIVLSMAIGISYGATDIDLATVWEATLHFNPDLAEHQVIQELRLPRVLAAALVGACLAVSGTIMQGMTRNPLASPSIMGVTDGAAFGLMVMMALFPSVSGIGVMLSSFIGAGLAVTAIFMISSSSGGVMSSVKLALAGVAIGTMLRAVTTILALHFQLEKEMGFWLAGGLDQVTWGSVKILCVLTVIGILLAISISKSMTVLSLGEDVSVGLGQNNLFVKILGIITVFALTGAAVSIAGAIGFVGLIVPHITRFVMGSDFRWIIPSSAFFGALLLVLSDVVARMVNAPYETPVGAITSLIGVPFFLYLARSKGGEA